MKKLFIPMSVGIVLMLVSCQGNTSYEHTIENNSSHPLKVVAKLKSGMSKDTVFIEAGQHMAFFFDSKMGGDPVEPSPVSFFDTIITETQGYTLTKNLMDETHWLGQPRHVKMIPACWKHSYKIDVTDSDFQ